MYIFASCVWAWWDFWRKSLKSFFLNPRGSNFTAHPLSGIYPSTLRNEVPLPGAVLLKKTEYHFPRSHQLPISSHLGGGTFLLLPLLKILSGLSSYILCKRSQLLWVNSTAALACSETWRPCSHPPALVLLPFLSLFYEDDTDTPFRAENSEVSISLHCWCLLPSTAKRASLLMRFERCVSIQV